MSGKLFLSSAACAGDRMTLEFTVGTPVVLENLHKRRDLPGGLAEHAVTVSRDNHHFNIRTIVDSDDRIQKVIVSSEPIADDWHEELTQE